MMPGRLTESLATTEELSGLFSDLSVVRAMLDFEVALATVQARLGVIPEAAAEAIRLAAQAEQSPGDTLARDSLRAGTPVIPMVKALTERVRAVSPEGARFVHWGATSQDVSDTALVLLLKRAEAMVAADLARLDVALDKLASAHASTVMLGRTLLRAAPPITFGLKAAGWLGAIRRGASRVSGRFQQALVLQFGGASGTLAALGKPGMEIGRYLAEELDLGFPDAPWHAHRDRLAALVCACGVLTGSLGKMARDVSLLMQDEVGEASEPGGEGRGGSSTMPHKRNPVACSLTLAAANRVPGLVAAYLAGMVQEHERGVGGWHAEWPTIVAVIQATGLAAASMAETAEGLTVDAARMRNNIEATRGNVFAERIMMVLAPAMGRDRAHKLLAEATERSIAEKRRLADVLKATPEVASAVPLAMLAELDLPELYLGSADEFRLRLQAMKEER
jgi:3-carboxy-cis,cis-muconate cycloisomerase